MSEILGQIFMPVLGSGVETARYILRETQATIGMLDGSDCFHQVQMEHALSYYFVLDHDFTASDVGLTGWVSHGAYILLRKRTFASSGPSGVLFPRQLAAVLLTGGTQEQQFCVCLR